MIVLGVLAVLSMAGLLIWFLILNGDKYNGK